MGWVLPGVLESDCQCSGHGFDPWPWRLPHAVKQHSLSATVPEAHVPRAHAPKKDMHC